MRLPEVAWLRAEVQRLSKQLSSPELMRDARRIKAVAAEHAQKEALLAAVEQYQRLRAEQAEAEQMKTEAALSAGQAGIQQLATEELIRLTHERTTLEKQLEALLLPQDPRDERDVIMEIRAGAGGEEAALFAAELFRAYTRYAELRGWKVNTVNTSLSEQGGYKEVIAEIAGSRIFGTLKFERGVHRVQRVPETEKMGRVHTSTVTVAVMPQAEEMDIVIRPEDLKIDTYRASGAGGQHVNKTSSAVRITHLPTNTVVAVQDERSQHKNKEKAMRILRSRILDAQEEARHQKETVERRLQIGTGDRSEKIRTYNFPQDRITDHRIKESWSNIAGVMEGVWEPIFKTLAEAERQNFLGTND